MEEECWRAALLAREVKENRMRPYICLLVRGHAGV